MFGNKNQNNLHVADGSPRPAQAGRELDAAVAEHVFGIKKIFLPSAYKSSEYAWGATDGPHYIPSGKSPRTHMIDAKEIPYFSTDIAAAMEVVKKLHASGWSVQVEQEENHPEWVVRFDRSTVGGLDVLDAESNSLPEAICRAALARARHT